jgi:hypothetical protein
MLFLNKNSNKTIACKKEYFIEKIEITPKRLQISIRNVIVAAGENGNDFNYFGFGLYLNKSVL